METTTIKVSKQTKERLDKIKKAKERLETYEEVINRLIDEVVK